MSDYTLNLLDERRSEMKTRRFLLTIMLVVAGANFVGGYIQYSSNSQAGMAGIVAGVAMIIGAFGFWLFPRQCTREEANNH